MIDQECQHLNVEGVKETGMRCLDCKRWFSNACRRWMTIGETIEDFDTKFPWTQYPSETPLFSRLFENGLDKHDGGKND